jgi:hypothetical protein
MTASNKIFVSIGMAIALTSLLMIGGCCDQCPPATPVAPQCLAPNPLVARQASGFSVSPGTNIAGAVNVIIISSDAQNQVLDTDTLGVTATQFYQYGPTAIRPIQLKFTYQDSSGQKLAEDVLRVDDSETNTGGVTALDVVLGKTAPNPPSSCPSTASQPIVTGTGSVNFAWAPEDWFKVIIVHNNVTKTFGLLVKPPAGGVGPGLITLLKGDDFSCLGNVAITLSEDEKSAAVETSSSTVTCTVSGTDNNDNQTPRRIYIVGPTGCNIAVMKKQ